MDRPRYRSAILSTREIAETAHYGGRKKRHRYAIPVAGALDLPDADLPLHPYLLGAWLGDGHSYGTQITAHRDDLEIAEHIRKLRLRGRGRSEGRTSPAGDDAVAFDPVAAEPVPARARHGRARTIPKRSVRRVLPPERNAMEARAPPATPYCPPPSPSASGSRRSAWSGPGSALRTASTSRRPTCAPRSISAWRSCRG